MTFFEAYEEMKNGKIIRRKAIFEYENKKEESFIYWRIYNKQLQNRANVGPWDEWDYYPIWIEDLEATDWEVVDEVS